MSAQHTPGPWEVHSGLIRRCEGDMCCTIAEMRGPYRKGVSHLRAYREEQRNARLIAAAPELHDSIDIPNLRQAAKLLADAGHGLHAGVLILMADRQEAALRKARGEAE